MGVKSLWNLLTPVGRPVMLETMEGKSMAIDSSIWIYQFQATMRDKEGRALINAHVLGFLRRICKLLFYGIKPVFVFDGGAPVLKRMTIAERKKKKSGAAESHVRIAERLLAAQLRREALNHAKSQKISNGKGKSTSGAVIIDENTVYLEDIDGSRPDATPAQKKAQLKEPTSSARKNRWDEKRDPYRLPDVDMDAMIEKATRNSSAPDPRLATEDELRAFLEMLRPEDLDVSSPAFKELPTEVQYEIIGDLRLKSRQTSYKRLQSMLRDSRTPLDFSRAQIVNLKQRNALTQQLLETTDSIGKANVTIPVRIASERNREYLLVKNEGEEGGWVLGIRNEGTQEKPIIIDTDESAKSEEESDDDMDMEEVHIPANPAPNYDTDLRDFQRKNAIDAIERRHSQSNLRGKSKFKREKPLFMPDSSEEADDLANDIGYEIEGDEILQSLHLATALEESYKNTEENDLDLAIAMQASIDEEEATNLRKAIEESRLSSSNVTSSRIQLYESPSQVAGPSNPSRHQRAAPSDLDDDIYADYTPSRLDTALRFANTSRNDKRQRSPPGLFSEPNLLLEFPTEPEENIKTISIASEADDEEDDEDMEEVVPFQSVIRLDAKKTDLDPHKTPIVRSGELTEGLDPLRIENAPEESTAFTITNAKANNNTLQSEKLHPRTQSPEPFAQSSIIHPDQMNTNSPPSGSSDVEGDSWSQHPTPGESRTPRYQHVDEGWDAAHEMNVQEEEGEFARFAAQVRGRDMNEVRKEIDEEIRQLNQQRKAAMRDSDEITQAMIAQIMTMLRLFGIPYITAPMEAEAQCATLVDKGLVDGVITDDSDVFLFGAKRVFKNMFNQAKTVECFLLLDLSRELGLDRGTLIRLAYLLGSDYVAGLPGVGPVVAMELIKEFPGEDGLYKFRDWWQKVQSGKDKESDNLSSFRKRFKKRFKDLYLPPEWPNPAVQDAYYNPTVDTSDEPFKWGLPDLDGLRDFFQHELSWDANKVDELLLPIIQKMNKRGQEAAMNRQDTLNNFFSIPEGAGGIEPRRRNAYRSRRLQAVVEAHKALRASGSLTGSTGSSAMETENHAEEVGTRVRREAGSGTGGTRIGVGEENLKHNDNSETGVAPNPRPQTQTRPSKRRKKDIEAEAESMNEGIVGVSINNGSNESEDPGSSKSARGRRGRGTGRGRGRGQGRGRKVAASEEPEMKAQQQGHHRLDVNPSTQKHSQTHKSRRSTKKRKKKNGPTSHSDSEFNSGSDNNEPGGSPSTKIIPSREMTLRKRTRVSSSTGSSANIVARSEGIEGDDENGEALGLDSEGSEYRDE